MTTLSVIVVDGTIDPENCLDSISFSPRDNHEEPNFPHISAREASTKE